MQFGLLDAVRHWSRFRHDKVALISNGHQTTYRALYLKAERIAKAIHVHRQPPHRVAVTTQRKSAFLAALLGVMRAGKSAILLNPRLSEESLHVTVSDTTPDLVVQDRDLAEAWSPPALEDIPRVIVEELKPEQTSDVPWPECLPSSEWGVVFSSGSTGVPKGIVRNHDSMIAEIIGWCLELPLTRQSVFYIGRPLFYTGGLVLALASLFVGATVIANDYRDDSDSDEVWSDFEEQLVAQKVDWAFFVPDQLRAFTRLVQAPKHLAAAILVMGAPISGAEKRKARETLGSQIVESWGNSESLGTITEPEDLDLRPDSVGRPFLTDELWVVDKETLTPCTPKKLGRIAGAVTAGFDEYSNRPEVTRQVKREKLIISDDIGYTDESGYFYVVGRDQDSLFQGNTFVSLPRVSEKIREQAGIVEAEVCSLGAGETVSLAAAIVLSPGCTEDLDVLRARLNSHLAPSEQLSLVVSFELLPQLPSGKVDRLAIQRRLRQEG